MPKKVADKKPTTTAKKTTRKKKDENTPVVETVAEVIASPVAETATADAPVKKRGRKPAAKKAETVFTTTLQIGDAEYDITDITAKAYRAFKSVHKRKIVTDFRVYVKPEEGAAYYTVNGEGAPDYKIDL